MQEIDIVQDEMEIQIHDEGYVYFADIRDGNAEDNIICSFGTGEDARIFLQNVISLIEKME